MGTAISQNSDLSSNEYLKKFVGKEKITQNDPFWNKLTAFNIQPPRNSNEQVILENKIEYFCQELLKNNTASENLGTIIDIFMSRSSELLAASSTEATLFNWQLFNILFIIRCILKFLTETLTEEQLIEQIESNGNGARLENLINALVGTIVDVPVKDISYGIHLEAVTILLVLLSVQLHSDKKSSKSAIYRLVMRGKHVIHAPLLIKNLLNNFMEQAKAPPNYAGNAGHSIVLGIAAELWSILTFNQKTEENENLNNFNNVPLATESLLLTLVLVHHWTSQKNPYRISLFSCLDSKDNSPTPPSKAPSLFKIDFNALYNVLCKKVSSDSTTLLLYLLLHQNQQFKTYLLNRLDIDHLVIPILKILYNAPNSNSHHIYMSLIILLILSEDEAFNQKIYEIKVKNISWYTERVLTDVSLGGLLILVVIRTIHYNMLKMRDKYLHTNCLAALANMSAQFTNLHPYVSQRLISLFEILARKYLKMCKKPNGTDLALNISTDTDLEQDLNVLEEVLRMVLEILNSCLTNQLINNPNLVYTLLYNKHIFEPFRKLLVFQDIVFNIEIIVNYFSKLLESKQYEVDANEVLGVIQEGAKHWPKEKLTKFPDLKFKYVEEDEPEDFFIPYVWNLVSEQSILHWTNDVAPLLTTNQF